MKLNKLILTLGLMTILSACGGGGGGGASAPQSISICLDSNSSNLGKPIPCICNAGYEISPDGISCSILTGTAYTYSASYTSYSPIQSATIPCSGTVTTRRTMTCLRSDSLVVNNSFCSSDQNPTSTVLSKAGSISVTPTNPSLTNGTEYLTCSTGTTTGTRSILCQVNYTISGSTLATQTCATASYTATFTTYSPTQVATTACSGTVTTTRQISSCRRVSDNVLVSNTLCTDPIPNSTVLSKPGLVSVTPTNPSLSNGTQFKSCSEGQIIGTEFISCNYNYHSEGTTLVNQNCYSNTRSCSPMPTGVTEGTQTWGVASYGSCVATACNTVSGYSLAGGVCSLVSERLTFNGSFGIQIMPDNTIKGWGLNEQIQLGQGDVLNKPSPVTINLGTGLTAKKVFSNTVSTCAILNDNSVKCWGLNNFGQLGVGDTVIHYLPTETLNLGIGKTAKDIIVGAWNFCAILNDDSLSCWGANQYGEIGQDYPANKTSPTAVNLGIGRTVSKVIMTNNSSYNTTCAILDDTTVSCFGYNNSGELGQGDSLEKTSPRTVKITPTTNLTGVKDIMILSDKGNTDRSSICAILTNNSLSCWGYNADGRLGVADTTNRLYASPVNLGTGRTVKKIYANKIGYMCSILDDSTVKCWGKNWGQLGDNSSINRTYPVSISFPSSKTVKELVLGNLGANCAIHTDNSLSCWGNNYRGQLGVGTNDITVNVPTSVDLSSKTVKSVASTADYVTCLILNDSTVKCSGDNTYGSLGTGISQSYSKSFEDVNLGSGITAVELRLGAYSVCALASDNKVYCWGLNSKGQIGGGSLATEYTRIPGKINY